MNTNQSSIAFDAKSQMQLLLRDVSTQRQQFPLLLIDDDFMSREIIGTYLNLAGFTVQLACNVDEAEQLLQQHNFRLVLCDWRMPVRDGLELCTSLRQQEMEYHYLLLMTGDTREESAVEGLQCGADDYVCKSVSAKELIARLDCGVRVLMAHSMLERQQQELLYRVQHDALTKVYNRAYLLDALPKLLANSQRYQTELSVVLVDIDHFKAVNDHFGHLSGDLVLQAVAALLQGAVRETDIVARYGGEEFMLIFPHTDRIHARQAAEKLRMQLAQQQVWLEQHQQFIEVTASFGITEYQADDNVDKLIQRADACLYHSKRHGRNRCSGPEDITT